MLLIDSILMKCCCWFVHFCVVVVLIVTNDDNDGTVGDDVEGMHVVKAWHEGGIHKMKKTAIDEEAIRTNLATNIIFCNIIKNFKENENLEAV